MYADDTALICEVAGRHAKKLSRILSTAVEEVSRFFEGWKIRLNANKTEFIALTKRPSLTNKLKKFPPTFNGHTFTWKDSVIYLGFTLDQKLTFKSHIEKVVKRASNMVRTLYCILKRNNPTKVQTKVQIYRAVIRPTMTYACPVYNNCAKLHFNKLQIQQNKVLRLVLNAERFTSNDNLHKEAKMPTIREYVDKITNNFYNKAKSHNNHLITALGNYNVDSFDFRLKHRLPLKFS